MKGSVVKRLEDLEKQQEEPPEVKLVWYDDAQEPPEPGMIRVQLHWLDEIKL
jgi:hypothetical protein